MALWSAGILLALGLAWFIGTVVVPVWQTHVVLSRLAPQCDGQSARWAVERLGGSERAVHRLALYMRLPPRLTKFRPFAALLLGYCDSTAVPALVRCLDDSEGNVRVGATWGLGLLGPQAREAVPGLTASLRDNNESVRVHAAWALGAIGPDAKGAVTVLEGLLNDTLPQVRSAAASALKQIRDEEAGK